jgi:kynureninase
MPRFEGWWGNDPSMRFRMGEEFVPVTSADAWGLSNPPILALLPVKVSKSIFDEVGIDKLRAKSLRLTGYLEWLINEITARAGANAGFQIITPTDPARRGCQLSILAKGDDPRALHQALQAGGVICDFREPNVIRVAPVPLYNSSEDCWRFAEVLAQASGVALS